ncbi:peptide ABC transporter substrate-binding protein [Caldalkalibacillus thermarum]|uniref:nickel transporter permease n=1 Tax=Caldalkalibacillus thermarum TaxID=296745 RepID=UPI00166D8B8B|nr:nickel transporter permease [Caldalkalibacillus thermarum]GGK16961.1 peptide ABC transporter substrate-binding protein [Caldalkalibacillus thermarum]GGK26082.1 peptide ABC transporter substrate-binding protein [Caldalkalibacillus thermarum]
MTQPDASQTNSTAAPGPTSPPKVGQTPFKNWKLFYKKLSKNKAAMAGGILIVILVIIALFPSLFATHDPLAQNLQNKLAKPSSEHWLGTDHLGRDIYSRIIYGTQITLYVGFVSVLIGAFFGVLLGIISGYYGGWIDALIMRIMDVLLAFPGILLALAIVSALGPDMINVIIAVAIFAVPTFARIVRGSTLAVRKMEYIEAIRALGARDGKIIFQHILPNVMSPIIVQGTLYIASAILIASGLSFLGLGAQPPTPEWGAMLAGGRNYIWDAPHVSLYPGIAIVVSVLAFNLLGDGLRDALDPRMKN